MIAKHFVDNISKQTWAHFFCTRLNVFIYFYLIQIILYTKNDLFAHS